MRNNRVKKILCSPLCQTKKLSLLIQHFLASLNPAINPIIYGVVNETFRRAITLQFPCFSKILKPQPLSTVSRSRPSVHQIRPGRSIWRSMFAKSFTNSNNSQTLSSDLDANRLSVVMNARL